MRVHIGGNDLDSMLTSALLNLLTVAVTARRYAAKTQRRTINMIHVPVHRVSSWRIDTFIDTKPSNAQALLFKL